MTMDSQYILPRMQSLAGGSGHPQDCLVAGISRRGHREDAVDIDLDVRWAVGRRIAFY